MTNTIKIIVQLDSGFTTTEYVFDSVAEAHFFAEMISMEFPVFLAKPVAAHLRAVYLDSGLSITDILDEVYEVRSKTQPFISPNEFLVALPW